MKAPATFLALTALSLLATWSQAPSASTVVQLTSPTQIANAKTIDFENQADGTVANTLYQAQGITFTRDDGQAIPIFDWAALGRETTSPTNVLATILDYRINTSYVTHVNVLSSSPLTAIGAYFGNDQGVEGFSFARLTIYDNLKHVIGSVDVAVNNNTSVDQFIGIQSTVPFSKARIENFRSIGVPSTSYSVVIDDLVFGADNPVPVGSTTWGRLKAQYH